MVRVRLPIRRPDLPGSPFPFPTGCRIFVTRRPPRSAEGTSPMTRSHSLRFAFVAVALAALAGAAMVANQAPPAGAAMATAADKFLATLTPEQKKKATFVYDDPQRTKWFFTP